LRPLTNELVRLDVAQGRLMRHEPEYRPTLLPSNAHLDVVFLVVFFLFLVLGLFGRRHVPRGRLVRRPRCSLPCAASGVGKRAGSEALPRGANSARTAR
jgi:hypothetical protein